MNKFFDALSTAFTAGWDAAAPHAVVAGDEAGKFVSECAVTTARCAGVAVGSGIEYVKGLVK